MSKFAFNKNRLINGVIDVYNLTIKDVDVFEEFRENLQTKHEKSFKKFVFYLEQMSSRLQLAHNKTKKIHNVTDGWELKSGSLRLYYLKFDSLLVICHLGYKKKQKKDIRRWRGHCDEIIQALINQKIYQP